MKRPGGLQEPGEATVEPEGFFVLRAPLLPFDVLSPWSEGAAAPGALEGDDARLEAALAEDRRRLREHLRAVVSRPEVREALFLASASLEASLPVWREAPESEWGQKVEGALLRYVSRMVGRATPLGLFAGCSLGTVGERTHLVLGPASGARRRTRLDIGYLSALTEALARLPEWRELLSYQPNSSLYPAAGKLRYVQGQADGAGWRYHLVAAEPTPYLEAALARAAEGASLAGLATALREDDPEVSPEAARSYVGALADHQLLVPELMPSTTGPDPLLGVLDRMRALPVGAPITRRLEQAHAALEALDAHGPGVPPESYQEVVRLLEELPAPAVPPRPFLVDVVRPAPEAVLGREVIEELARGVELLRRLSPPLGQDALRRFREDFLARYERREVPLLEALDEESGIGFASGTDTAPLLRGLTFPAEAETRRWSARHTHLLRRREETLRSGARELALTPEDVKALTVEERLPLPDAFMAMATLAAESDAALASGDFRLHLPVAAGPSGARLLGRFCGVDAGLEERVREHLRAEEALRPEALFAEVVHLPEGPGGNLLLRPALRGYEIPFLGSSGVPPEQRIPLSDLRVSVVGERVVLRSERLGREILPRLTSSHAYAIHGLQVYRFLCSLQEQELAGSLFWDWGPLSEAGFLPRVTAGRLVLSLARWRVNAAELEALAGARGAARYRAVWQWRARRDVPRWVALKEGDKLLPLDLEGEAWVEAFLQLVKKEQEATLVELFPGPEALCARGPDGRYVHELVLPFRRVRAPAARAPRPSPPPVARLSRSFPPGAEWLFAKLYSGGATADRLLRETVRPLVREALASRAADHWFFIRYADPEPHLRVRLHGPAARLTGEVLPALQARVAPLLEQGLLWRLQLDTYEREVERYGGPEGILVAEQLFRVDSEAVVALLEAFPGDAAQETRWLLALLGMERLLADLGLEGEAGDAVLEQARAWLGQELRMDEALEHQLGARYRQERGRIEAALGGGRHQEAELAAARAVLEARSQALAPEVQRLHELAAAGRLTVPLSELAASFIHMHVNRLLRSAWRSQELVLYDFLLRHRRSQAARRRPRPARGITSA
jgi:thiopeptide-type bacteriocin biosynthesis protein